VEGLCPPPAPTVAAPPSAAGSPSPSPSPPPRCFRLPIAGVVGETVGTGASQLREDERNCEECWARVFS
jgi:hypothetical protein